MTGFPVSFIFCEKVGIILILFILLANQTFHCFVVGISMFATMIPEIIDIVGNQQKYGGNYQVKSICNNKNSRQKL